MLEVHGWHKYEIGKSIGFGTLITPDQREALISRIVKIEGVYHCEFEDEVIKIESNIPVITQLRAIVKDINNNQY